MRELKFRFWNTIARRFQPSKRYAIDGNGKLLGYDFEFARYDDNPVPFSQTCIIPQQYTGLQDKHGKYIYEGDIVSGICLNDGPQICVVGFDTFGIFYTKIKYHPCEEWDNIAMLAQEYNEVIGNIFENPELLKQ